MTGQSLLNIMELLNAELQLQSGETDSARGLLALNVAQDYFESVAAQRPQIFGSGVGTVVTATNVETTTYPAGLLRIDRIQLLDANNKPVSNLVPIRKAGGHINGSWPLNLFAAGTGLPSSYWTNGTLIYWSPLPSGVSTLRWYGFPSAADITAVGTFSYPDIVSLPLASFAARIIKAGVDDDAKDLASVALESFTQVLDALGNVQRDGAVDFEYTRSHTT